MEGLINEIAQLTAQPVGQEIRLKFFPAHFTE